MSYAYATTNLLTGLAAASFTLTGGPSDATRSYLNDGRMDKLYAFNATASQVVMVVDLGSAVAACGVGVLNHNLAQASGTPAVSLQGASDAGFTTSVTSVYSANVDTAAPRNKDSLCQLPFGTSVSRRYWKITLSWTGTFTATVGEFFLFLAPTVLSRGSVYGSGESEQYFDVANEMMYGDTRAYLLGGPVRRKQLKFSDFTSSDKDEHRALWSAIKNRTGTLLWIENRLVGVAVAGDLTGECIFGRLWKPNPWTWTQDDFNVYQPSALEIRSLGREVGS